MKNFVGIDLGTTNSAICTYNGSEIRIWKSPDQHDVTPSAIYIDKRTKYIGARAYNAAPHNKGNVAILFKRFMGTNNLLHFSALNISKSPEECSAEILRVLFGYLPEELRNDPETGTVITVPAAFNQMQKDATMQAAAMAGIGRIALMQEPVAAVMSVMRARQADGMFLIYDIGGGTLDVAIAESISGRVNLLAHGGIAMCGGRDFDRAIRDQIVRPWLLENFDLPDDLSVNPQFQPLMHVAIWAVERAKMELSAREESVISLSETETRARDLKGNEIYLEIPLQRHVYDSLIAAKLDETIDASRETLKKTGLTPHDMERIVFIGGPTHYKPLRDKISFSLGIPGSTDVNPMTAVAEGASLFAESIGWDSHNHARKSNRGQISSSGTFALGFNYIARTPSSSAKIAAQLSGEVLPGSEFQIDSIDTGWTSGRLPLRHAATLDLPLAKAGDNTFKVFVFDAQGGPIAMQQDKIVITKTAATIDAIPASHSVFVEVLDKLGGRPVKAYLIQMGDALPKKGKQIFKAAHSLKAGAVGSLNFRLWEGEIEEPIVDNRLIGCLKIAGSDFDDGVIPAGGDLECEFEILDSGNIVLEVSVPSIGGTFHSGKNFYSRLEGQRDYASASVQVADEGRLALQRLDDISEAVSDPKLEQARQKLETAVSLAPEDSDAERVQEASENVQAAKRLLAQVREEHKKVIRQIDLDALAGFFNKYLRQDARPSEITTFDSLVKTAQRSIDRNDPDFEYHLGELRSKNFGILWRQDWFVVEQFKRLEDVPDHFADKRVFEELVTAGKQCMREDDIDKLRPIVAQLSMLKIGGPSEGDMMAIVNILKG